MKPEQWQQVIDINLTGVFYCSQVSSSQPVTISGTMPAFRVIHAHTLSLSLSLSHTH
jgi:NAD(P)-dependent dehydrogenase (short-subunit alcohol dehydrogenase family)